MTIKLSARVRQSRSISVLTVWVRTRELQRYERVGADRGRVHVCVCLPVSPQVFPVLRGFFYLSEDERMARLVDTECQDPICQEEIRRCDFRDRSGGLPEAPDGCVCCAAIWSKRSVSSLMRKFLRSRKRHDPFSAPLMHP